MSGDKTIAVVGAGLSGAVIGRELAERGHRIEVFDSRGHVAGNCHTERDAETGVMVHVYGPHIFHTDDEEVWDYVKRFQTFRPYKHVVKTLSGGRVYSLPVNLHTINQFFGMAMRPDEAREFIARRRPFYALLGLIPLASYFQQWMLIGEVSLHDTDTLLRLLWIVIAVPGFLSSRVAVQALVASAALLHMLVYISLLFVRLH